MGPGGRHHPRDRIPRTVLGQHVASRLEQQAADGGLSRVLRLHDAERLPEFPPTGLEESPPDEPPRPRPFFGPLELGQHPQVLVGDIPAALHLADERGRGDVIGGEARRAVAPVSQ